MGLGDSTYRRRLDWGKREAKRFQSMVAEKGGGEFSHVESLAQSQSEGVSQSQSRMSRSIRSSGASSCSRAPS